MSSLFFLIPFLMAVALLVLAVRITIHRMPMVTPERSHPVVVEEEPTAEDFEAERRAKERKAQT